MSRVLFFTASGTLELSLKEAAGSLEMVVWEEGWVSTTEGRTARCGRKVLTTEGRTARCGRKAGWVSTTEGRTARCGRKVGCVGVNH